MARRGRAPGEVPLTCRRSTQQGFTFAVPSATFTTSRRRFLHGSLTASALALIAAACGKSSGSTLTAPPAPTAPASTPPVTTAPASTGATSSSRPPATTSATRAAGAFDVAISFAYVAAASGGGGGGRGPGGGQIHNPYVAVWVEDAEGKAVRTISLNYQRGKGDKWLNELRRWFRVDQARVAAGGKSVVSTLSQATRVPGAYNVAWDGLTDTGVPIAPGAYYVCIESSRENGPYSLIREQLTFDGSPFEKALAPQGELQDAVVKLKSR